MATAQPTEGLASLRDGRVADTDAFWVMTPPGPGGVVMFGDTPIEWRPSLALRNHSPTGLAWGYPGSGPAQLALSVLLAVADQPTALARYQAFKGDVIARLPADGGWRFTVAEVRRWIADGSPPAAVDPSPRAS